MLLVQQLLLLPMLFLHPLLHLLLLLFFTFMCEKNWKTHLSINAVI
jgi:hypothetical protein